jgi:hypothetical protein
MQKVFNWLYTTGIVISTLYQVGIIIKEVNSKYKEEQ